MAQTKNIKKLRVLQIVPQIKFGGVERGVIDIFRYLNRLNIENFIFCETVNKDFISKEEKKFVFTSNSIKFKNITHYFQLNKILENIIKIKKINLVHISSRAPAFVFLKQIKSNLNVRYITSFHNPYSGRFLKKYYNSFLLKSDLVICNSNFTKKYVLNNFNKEFNRIKSIPRGIDTKYFNPSFFKKKFKSYKKDLLNIKSNEIVISIPSRFSKWKGHNQLIDYFNNQKTKLIKKIKIIFFVDNNELHRKKLLSLCSNELNKKIIILNLTHDIREIYAISDLIISSSIKPEGFGRTISEALSMNCIPIGVNHGGVREQLYNFDKKLLYKMSDPKSFNRTLDYALSLLNNSNFDGRSYVNKKYSLDKMLLATINSYLYEK